MPVQPDMKAAIRKCRQRFTVRPDESAYNGSLDKQGDLGYWVGYGIVKSYYEHASDKR